MKDPHVEGYKRDHAIGRAQNNPDNNYDLILLAARSWVVRRPDGARMVSGEVFAAVMERHPDLEPEERRVMGAVMRALQLERLIKKVGISTRERTHRGMTTEWQRVRS